MIKLLRIDHRLLHGQVAFSWSKQLGTDCILLACDTLLNDKLRMSAIKMAKPSGVKVVAKTVDDAIAAIKSGVTDKYKLLIVVQTIHDAYRLVQEVPAIKSINLGGAKKQDGYRQISKAIFVGPQDEEDIKAMLDKGVEVEIRQLASESSVPVQSVL